MMACGGKGNNVNQDNDTQPQIVENLASNPEEVIFDVFDDVDWDRPLYSLDKNGDTTEVWRYDRSGKLVSYYELEGDTPLSIIGYRYDNVKDSLTYFARKSQFTTWKYEEPKENIVQKAAEQLLSEEYIEGLACQSKTVATVPVDDGEMQTIACYQRSDGSWLVMEYWPTQGPENDKLSVYVLDKGGKLEPSDAQNLPLNLDGMRVLGNELFFPYQGDALQFGNDYFIFPMEDAEPLRLEWNGEQFVVAK